VKQNKQDKLIYSNDKLFYQVKDNIVCILGWAALFVWWYFSISFQSGLYTLMYICSFAMVLLAAVTAFKCKEERANILRTFKLSFMSYLTIIFVYDLIVQVAIMDKINSVATPDAALITAGNFMTNISTILKISGAVAFLTYSIKTLGVFKIGVTRKEQMVRLRDYRENTSPGQSSGFDYSDRF